MRGLVWRSSLIIALLAGLAVQAIAQEDLDSRCRAAAQRLIPSAFSGTMPDVTPLSDAEFLDRITDLATRVGEISQKNPGAWVESNRIALQGGDVKARYDIRLTEVQGGAAIQQDGLQLRCQVTFGTAIEFSFSRPVWHTAFSERDIDVAAQSVENPTSTFGEMVRGVRRASYTDKVKAAQSALGKEAMERLLSSRSVFETARPPIKFQFTTAGSRGNETILDSDIYSTYLTAGMKMARAAATNQAVLSADFDRWAAALWERVSARSPADRAAAAQRRFDADKAAKASVGQEQRQALQVIWPQIQKCLADAPVTDVVIRIRLNMDGSLNGLPEVVTGQDSPYIKGLISAVARCAPFRIPSSLTASYSVWKTIHLRFQ